MNEGQSVVLGDSNDNDELVCVEDDEELLELVAVGGVLDKIRSYVYSPIPEDSSAPVHCRFSEHVDILCNYIAEKEKLRFARIYPAIVVVGYGVRMRKIKDEKDLISDLSEILSKMRLSLDGNDRSFANGIKNVTMHFQGDRRSFRLENTLIAQINETARACGTSSLDMFYYYFLIGISELIEKEDSLSEIEEFEEYETAMLDLKHANRKLNSYKVLLTRQEAC